MGDPGSCLSCRRSSSRRSPPGRDRTSRWGRSTCWRRPSSSSRSGPTCPGSWPTDPELKEIVGALPKAHVDAYYSGQASCGGCRRSSSRSASSCGRSWADKVKAKPPEDWDELTALAERFTREDPDGNGQAGHLRLLHLRGAGGHEQLRHPVPVQRSGRRDAAPDRGIPTGKPSFNTDAGREVARALHRWQHEKKVTPPATPMFTHKEFYEVVQAGKCGIGRVGAWNVGPWAKSAVSPRTTW